MKSRIHPVALCLEAEALQDTPFTTLATALAVAVHQIKAGNTSPAFLDDFSKLEMLLLKRGQHLARLN